MPTIKRDSGSASAAALMTAMRCRRESDVASPVVPQTFSASQPELSRYRESATKRGRSGSQSAEIGVGTAAITPFN